MKDGHDAACHPLNAFWETLYKRSAVVHTPLSKLSLTIFKDVPALLVSTSSYFLSEKAVLDDPVVRTVEVS